MAVKNLFDIAPSAPKATKKSSKVEREEISIGPKLDKVAAFSVIAKVLENESSLVVNEVKAIANDIFVKAILRDQAKPVSFLGLGDRASASVEFRKNSTRSPLSVDAQKVLRENNIPFDKSVSVPQRYIVNPNLDQATLLAISAAIQADKNLAALDIIQMQPEEFTYTVSDKTIDAIAQVTDEPKLRTLVELTSTLAVGKFGFDHQSITDGDKQITEDAKAISLSLLQDMGVFPPAEVVTTKKSRTKKQA